jgi:hypothetical protein
VGCTIGGAAPADAFCIRGDFFEKCHSMRESRRASCSIEKRDEAVKQRSIKCIKKREQRGTEKNKVFSQLPPPTTLSLPIHLFIQPCFSHSGRQTKKKRGKRKNRTHKTPIHKIKPIPSLSWANCLLDVLGMCFVCVDMKTVYALSPSRCFCPCIYTPMSSRSAPAQLLFNVLFLQRIAFYGT